MQTFELGVVRVGYGGGFVSLFFLAAVPTPYVQPQEQFVLSSVNGSCADSCHCLLGTSFQSQVMNLVLYKDRTGPPNGGPVLK